MKLKSAILIGGISAFGVCAPASAAFNLTNSHGTFLVDEFDWASNGTAWTQGFIPAAGDTFTLFYASYAVAVNRSGSAIISPLQGLDATPNGSTSGAEAAPPAYEYTIFATVNEQVQSCTTVATTTTCTFSVLGGSYDIWYDTTTNANGPAQGSTTWTGFEDGVKIISGVIDPSTGGSFVSSGPTGTGSATLFGHTTSQNNAFVTPTLDGTTATTTLQIGAAAGTFVYPTTVDARPTGTGTDVTFKADANQQFATAVPEPSALALIGIALAGLGGFSRRKSR